MQQNDENGPFIQSVSGKTYHFNSEDPNEVDILDIASSLSRLCRFNGHLKNAYRDDIYTVAQHSVYVLWDLEKRLGKGHAASMFALLHDAPKTYVTDIPTPLKGMLTEYESIESKCERNVMEALDVPVYKYIEVEVKVSDVRLLYAEAAAVTSIPLITFGLNVLPTTLEDIDPDFYVWGPADARRMFLKEYERISGIKLEDKETADDSFEPCNVADFADPIAPRDSQDEPCSGVDSVEFLAGYAQGFKDTTGKEERSREEKEDDSIEISWDHGDNSGAFAAMLQYWDPFLASIIATEDEETKRTQEQADSTIKDMMTDIFGDAFTLDDWDEDTPESYDEFNINKVLKDAIKRGNLS